jgi:hypothetical protein
METELQSMGAVAVGEAHGIPRLALAQADDFEQFTHFMLHDQLLRHGAFWPSVAFSSRCSKPQFIKKRA